MMDPKRPDDRSDESAPECTCTSSPPSGPVRDRARPRRISTRDLLGPDDTVHIEHDGELYTLRRTRAGRLILTK